MLLHFNTTPAILKTEIICTDIIYFVNIWTVVL